MQTIVKDSQGREFKVGGPVRLYGGKPGAAADNGLVTAISDPDGDVNDYGRQVYYPPRVSVRFFDGVEDSFSSHATYEDETHRCEDLHVVEVCPECHGDGTITVGGYSVSPFSGVLVSDPQMAHDETCPACGGKGATDE
jgi:hypothetical protein